jgi:hypothetical protein
MVDSERTTGVVVDESPYWLLLRKYFFRFFPSDSEIRRRIEREMMSIKVTGRNDPSGFCTSIKHPSQMLRCAGRLGQAVDLTYSKVDDGGASVASKTV